MGQTEYANYTGCTLRPFAAEAGRCDGCGAVLTGRRTRWCSDTCRDFDFESHFWAAARRKALERDGHRCIRCGATEGLQVNHIDPRIGRGYMTGCWNHPDGLETLCPSCHQETTNEQRRLRASASQGALEFGATS